MRGLGEYLAAQGATVLAVRLAGHGSTPEDLQQTRWRDWLASAEQGLQQLQQHCARIIVVGFSLGGALSIMMHHMHRRAQVEKLVLLATPLWLQGDWRLHLLPIARYVVPWFYPLENADLSDPFIQARIRHSAPDANLDDPATREALRRNVRLPVAAIHELQRVLRVARKHAPRVTTPTLMMHGRDDDTAPPASADELLQRLGSREKRLVWWEQTGHQLLVVGPHREAIYARVAAFIAGSAPAAA
jgi:carboxylesterase